MARSNCELVANVSTPMPRMRAAARSATNDSPTSAPCASATQKKWVKLRSSMSWPELR